MKRVLVLMLTVMVAFWLTGCGSSVSQEELDALNKQNSELQEQIDALESRLSATPTPSPLVQEGYNNFVQRYNEYIGEADTPDKIEMLSEDNNSFQPTTWTKATICFNEDGTLDNVLFASEPDTAVEDIAYFFKTVNAMTVVAYGIDESMTENQSVDFRMDIMQNYFFDDQALKSTYETRLNQFNYSFFILSGNVCMSIEVA